LDGRRGPKAAGRARKKVELSSVKLIIAEGGNREYGAWNEKRERSRLVPPENDEPAGASRWGYAERRETAVRRIGRRIKQNKSSMKRGGRMMMVDERMGSGTPRPTQAASVEGQVAAHEEKQVR
jgi:hypothetical protein